MSFRVERNVMVPMRDGVTLATDVWIPEGEPVPTLLVRLPYGKDTTTVMALAVNPNTMALLDAGYAVVRQDCRGSFASSGEFTPLTAEFEDGVDTLAWIREQPWSDGTVGTYGASYLGFTQWASAVQNPEGLKAIAPSVSNPDFYNAWHSEGGALTWHNVVFWATFMALTANQRALAAGGGDPQASMNLSDAVTELLNTPNAALADSMPSGQTLLAELLPWWPEWLNHPDRDDYWRRLSSSERFGEITVPALHIGGWFDLFAETTARTYTRMKAEAGSPEAREGQRLIMGPWNHQDYSGINHDRQFGGAADIVGTDVTDTYLRFFDRWLRERADALDGHAPVRIFVMGIDQWRDEQDWPLPDTTYVDYYLDGAGRAATAEGDGILRTDLPSAEATDTYTYDPARPVPTLGGRLWLPSALNAVGPVDQREVESRDDVLCYSTPVLDEPLEVTGHISLVLHIASSARDTDFTGKLVDVFPDGRAIYLTDGILRARYRNSLAAPELLEPEQVYEVTLDLSVTSNVFLPGHRLRLEVSSSNFPRFDRNTNTGGQINTETLDQAVVAVNRVLHGPDHPSRLILPVIRR
ncbi:CocE/NonD family hydrolase [Nocardia sp. NPDC019395]|uniref:CocE/NonD family hydrolase n=1 Tax=Nocardia sp. NPDC019395 TaxID=3154686 RepID=UPI0033F8DEF9